MKQKKMFSSDSINEDQWMLDMDITRWDLHDIYKFKFRLHGLNESGQDNVGFLYRQKK